MPDKADLHIHTSCSDGQLSPEDVIKLALDKKLKAVAITDHDTFEGYKSAKDLAVAVPQLRVTFPLPKDTVSAPFV